MENVERGLNITQACESAPKNKENNSLLEEQKEKEAALRFGGLSLGCFVYAVLYTFCMYQNKESITFPFFVGATLYFFYYFTKKYCGSVPKNNRFLVVSIAVLGVLTCTTASSVVIHLNKLLILLLLCVLLLKTYYDVAGWSIANYLCSAFYVVCGSLVNVFIPFADLTAFVRYSRKNGEKKELSEQTKQRIFAIAAGFVVAIPMVLTVLMLLSGADIYFRGACEDVLTFIFDREFDFTENVRDVVKICLTVLVFFAVSYGVLTYMNGKNGIEKLVQQKRTQWDSFAAITFCSLIGIIYVFFVWIQIAGLFMGKLTLPYGYTYAEYAREGFFQLVFVCLFNLCLVLVCIHCFQKHKVLQILLTIISLCTYVMLISSAYRMFMYIAKYQLTFLRVLVLWGILVIAIVMAGVIVAIFKERFPLFSYLLVTITSMYIVFAAMHPDYVIARYNIAQKEKGSDIDEWYLRYDLSLDAAGVVLNMYEKELQDQELYAEYLLGQNNTPEYVLDYYGRVMEQTEGMNLRTFNVSKGIAHMHADDFMELANQNLAWIEWVEKYQSN